MIKAECWIFLSMLAGGALAGAVATALFTLGRASKVSKCTFDFLTPLIVGAIFLVSSYLASGGVFRLYALLAFLLGGWLFSLLYRLLLPYIKRVISRLIVPIKSLEDRINARLEPLREKKRARRALRAEEREERRRRKEEKRAKERAEKALKCESKRAKREKKRRLARVEKARCAESRRRERSALRSSTIEQSH